MPRSANGGISASPRATARRAATRERQTRSLRARRLEVTPKDPKVIAALGRGFDYLDRLEARGEPMSRSEVAAQLGLTHEAVRLIERRALAKVRAALGIEGFE
jgi:DNA-directed RNA polymerase sigma subunit (sigma70/sigma32)